MENQQQQLPPIKAQQPGRGKRKHTLAPARLNSEGKVEIHLLCVHDRCGCSGWFVLEDLLREYERVLKSEEEEREAA